MFPTSNLLLWLKPPAASKGSIAHEEAVFDSLNHWGSICSLLFGLYLNTMSAEMPSPSISQLVLGLEQAARSQISPGRCLGEPQPELKHTEARSGRHCKVLEQLSFSQRQVE